MKELAYEETVLYGQHSRTPLSKFAKRQAFLKKLTTQQFIRNRHNNEPIDASYCSKARTKLTQKWKTLSETHFGKILEDFIFLTSLGIIVSIFSFLIDVAINRCHSGRLWLLNLLHFSIAGQFFAWVGFYVIFTCFAVGATHYIAPTAIGSGIPEVKTMIQGVVMKEYLTMRNLIAKIIGLTAALGSGLPVGKEGPFVHIAAVSAALIAKILPSFSSEHENHETRMADILSPASAVGLSCTFASPVGGLLYSIEGTSDFFAMKNYWRCFYASAVGTISFRFLAIWFTHEETLTALERTYLPQEVPFDPAEVIAFIILGICCGLTGAFFIQFHQCIVVTLRGQKKLKAFLQKNRFIYPTIVAFIIGALQFPPGLGQYIGGELTNPEALKELFSNFTWSTLKPRDIDEQHVLHNWLSPDHNIFLTIGLFFIMRLWMCALSTTCPLPCGLIVPAFTIGAGLGRLFGETMTLMYPDGVHGNTIVPGGYALIGSAAFAGAVTHTFSPVIIIFELTGQIGHILPCLMAVMIANAVCRFITPSVYELIIQLKKLPYLPHHIDKAINAHEVLAEDIMIRNVECLTVVSTLEEAYCLLRDHSFKSFPIVDSRDNMILKGSIERRDLKRILEDRLSLENKLEYFSSKLRSVPLQAPPSSVSIHATIEDESHLPPEVRKTTSGRKFSVIPINDEPHRKTSAASNSQQNPAALQGDGQPGRKISTVSIASIRKMSLVPEAPLSDEPEPERKISACSNNSRKMSQDLPVICKNEQRKHSIDSSISAVSTARKTSLSPESKVKEISAENITTCNNNNNNNKDNKISVKGDQVRFKMSTTIDLHDPEKEEEWKNYTLAERIDYRKCKVDQAPFQMVVQTSLYKIHHLFSLLSLHHTFVTDRGRLVGFISISEVRAAVQTEVNSLNSKSVKDKLRFFLGCHHQKEGVKDDNVLLCRLGSYFDDNEPEGSVPLDTINRKSC